MSKSSYQLENNITGRRMKLFTLINRLRPVELALLVKWMIRTRRRWHKSESLRFHIDPCSAFGLRLLKYGIYEAEMINSIKKLLKPGDTFIDLGGNEGYFSVIGAKQVGANGRVFCIEPQERLWPTIIKNASANNFSNITLVPLGISNIPGQALITLYPSLNTGASSIVSTFRSRFYPNQIISLCTLDSLIKNYFIEKVDLLKIDIEGFEVNALISASESLKNKRIKKLLIEIHPQQLKQLGQKKEDLFSLMLGYGYRYKHYGEIHLFEVDE